MAALFSIFDQFIFEIFSKCWIYDFLKPHKISAYLDNFFFIVSKRGPKEKNSKTKKSKKSAAKFSLLNFLALFWHIVLNNVSEHICEFSQKLYWRKCIFLYWFYVLVLNGEYPLGVATGFKARTYLQLPLWQWGAGNVYLLVLSS